MRFVLSKPLSGEVDGSLKYDTDVIKFFFFRCIEDHCTTPGMYVLDKLDGNDIVTPNEV